MTRRDILWRGAGVALSGGACGMAVATDGSPLVAILFPVALGGLALVIHGKRVAVALRAERHGHRHTAEVIHAGRVRRQSKQADPIRRRTVSREASPEPGTVPDGVYAAFANARSSRPAMNSLPTGRLKK